MVLRPRANDDQTLEVDVLKQGGLNPVFEEAIKAKYPSDEYAQ